MIVPWTHIQPCPGHIYNRVLDTYNCALDTFYTRVFDTFKCVFTSFIYGKKTKILTHFKLLPNFQAIVQRKYVSILAVTFAVGIEPRTLGPILYHYTTWPKELLTNEMHPPGCSSPGLGATYHTLSLVRI